MALYWAAAKDWLSILRAGGMNLGYDNGIDMGDSGDELGEVSAAERESNVEMVVVGDDSVDPMDDTLSRCWNGRRCFEGFAETLGDVPRRVCTPFSSSLSGKLGDIPPKTDIKDGNESGMGGGLV